MRYEPVGTCSCHTCNCPGCVECTPFDELYPDLCPRCQGDGQIITDDERGPAWTLCHSCGGSGERRAA